MLDETLLAIGQVTNLPSQYFFHSPSESAHWLVELAIIVEAACPIGRGVMPLRTGSRTQAQEETYPSLRV